MLSFDVRSLAVKAASVAGELAADDPIWLAEDSRPDGVVAVTGRLSVAGHDRYYFSGQLSGEFTEACTRCLTTVKVPVTADAAVIFSDALAEDEDDPDVYPLAEGGTRVDLRAAVRELWLLHVPAFVRCREDCRGICPQCGADLNAGACSCAPVHDSRWTALRTLRSRAD